MPLDPFREFLAELPRATNESAKRHLFTVLAATGFRVRDLATELAVGAEYQVRFAQAGVLRRGAIDSFFGNFVIEFENDLRRTRDHALDQLRGYVAGAWAQEGRAARAFLAVACDGLRWEVFAPRIASDAAAVDASNVELVPVEQWTARGNADDAESLKLFLNRLFFRSDMIAPSAQNFVRDFGLGSPAYLRVSEALVSKLKELADDRSVQVKQAAWHDSLQISYGSVETDDVLFAKHSYLAVLARLLVWAALERRPLEQRDLPAILDGTYFLALRIANLVEEDFFRWHEATSNIDASPLWVGLGRHLAGYELGSINEDILKPLYEQLVDPETRHVLGEYYTPDWLAEEVTRRVLESWDWGSGLPRIIDPACGSGTFLRSAIEQCRVARKHLGKDVGIADVVGAVVGIDVHPLAVTISRATYLLAVKDLIDPGGPTVTLPVFLANSLSRPTPGDGTLFGLGNTPLHLADSAYAVPTEFVLDVAAYDEAIDHLVAVGRAYGDPKSVLADAPRALAARLGRRLEDQPQAEALVATLGTMAHRLAELIRDNEDSVHGFLLKNHLRPTMLRRSFDFVLGNPPWLTVGDIETVGYKALIVDLATSSAIAPRAIGEQSHTELATIFLAGAVSEFLNDNRTQGLRVGFVMPRSVFTASHHRLLREGSYRPRFRVTELWDLEEVSPLFNVPTCVVFASRGLPTPTAPIRGRAYGGALPAKELPGDQARRHLAIAQVSYRLAFLGRRSAWVRLGDDADAIGSFGPVASANDYAAAFEQGAILYPQTLFVVAGAGAPLRRGVGAVQVRVDDRARRNAKLLRDVDLRLAVDSENLYLTVVAEHLLPFTLVDSTWTVVLPTVTDPSDAAFCSVDANTLRRAGRVDTAAWLDWAQAHWQRVRKAGDSTALFERIDYLHHLSSQAARPRYVVLYTSQGARPVAAAVDTAALALPFVARDSTYWTGVASLEEADYVAAFLNSAFVSGRIEAWQTRGLFGARHVHKRPLDVPWPRFDRDDPRHTTLAAASASLREAAGALRTQVPDTTVGIQRIWVRKLLARDHVGAVETLVEEISGARVRRFISMEAPRVAVGDVPAEAQ